MIRALAEGVYVDNFVPHKFVAGSAVFHLSLTCRYPYPIFTPYTWCVSLNAKRIQPVEIPQWIKERMAKKSTDWRDLYTNKTEDEPALPDGPILFYNELVIEHFTNPRNVGEMPGADGYALVGDPSCGDQMKLWIKVEEGRISDIKFKSYGCPGAIATSSMATVLAQGKTLAEAKKLTDDDVVLALGGIPENKRHCSLMGINALLSAIQDYEKKHTRHNPV